MVDGRARARVGVARVRRQARLRRARRRIPVVVGGALAGSGAVATRIASVVAARSSGPPLFFPLPTIVDTAREMILSGRIRAEREGARVARPRARRRGAAESRRARAVANARSRVRADLERFASDALGASPGFPERDGSNAEPRTNSHADVGRFFSAPAPRNIRWLTTPPARVDFARAGGKNIARARRRAHARTRARADPRRCRRRPCFPTPPRAVRGPAEAPPRFRGVVRRRLLRRRGRRVRVRDGVRGGVYETQARVIAEAAAAIPQVQARWEALHLTAFKLAANRVREINAWGDDARKGPREAEGEGGAEAARGVRRAASGAVRRSARRASG